MNTLVSVIVPVYNVEAYLLDCLYSIFAQNYAAIEVIAINDGSTDTSLEILKNYAAKDSRLKIITQENKGLSGARNTGLEHAIGDYILFVDSDDYVSHELIECCLKAFETHKTEMVIFNHAEFKDGSNDHREELKNIDSGFIESTQFLKQTGKLPTLTWNPVWLYAYKRSFLEKNALKFHEGILHEDILFTPMALANAESLVVLSNVLYFYRQRKGSITTDPEKAKQSLKDYAFIAERLHNYSQSIEDQEKKEVFIILVLRRYQFIIEICQNEHSEFSNSIYNDVIKSLRQKKAISKLFAEDFYREHIETKVQRKKRQLIESIMKWPRRVCKYKIKPFFNNTSHVL